jgi:hypothetical protein
MLVTDDNDDDNDKFQRYLLSLSCIPFGVL